MTIPKAAREAARLAEGDLVVVEVEGERLVIRKLVASRDPYLVGLEASLDEWNSPEDEAAWRELWGGPDGALALHSRVTNPGNPVVREEDHPPRIPPLPA